MTRNAKDYFFSYKTQIMIRLLFLLLLTSYGILANAQAIQTIKQNNDNYLLFEAEAFAGNYSATLRNDPNWKLVQEKQVTAVGADQDGVYPIQDYSSARLYYRLEVTSSGWYYLYINRKVKDGNTASFIVPRINEAVSSNTRRRVNCTSSDTLYNWQSANKSFFLEAGKTYSLFLLPEAAKSLLLDQILLHKDNALNPAKISSLKLKPAYRGNNSLESLLRYWEPEVGKLASWKAKTIEGGETVKAPRESGYLPYTGKSFVELSRKKGVSRLVMDTIDYSRCLLAFSNLTLHFQAMSPEFFQDDNDTIRVYAILKGLQSQVISLGEFTDPVNGAYIPFDVSATWNNAFFNKIVFVIEYTGGGDERLWLDDIAVQYHSLYETVLTPPTNIDIIADTLLLGNKDYTFSLEGGITDTIIKRSTFFWSFNDKINGVVVAKDTFRYRFQNSGFYTASLTIKTKALADKACDSIATVINKVLYIAKGANASPVGGHAFLLPPAQNLAPELKLYPNPTTDQLNISSPDRNTLRYELLNLSGQVMQTNQFTGQEAVMMHDWPQGIYLARIFDLQGRVLLTQKIIKQ